MSPPRSPNEFSPDGVLLVDKPSGPTSHDVVDVVRRRFRIRKAGHGGTLDPQATGLLILLLGRGTKLSAALMNLDKTYQGSLELGVATDTQDAQGTVIRRSDPASVTRDALEKTLQRFRGDILQTPPMVSAVKHAGMPLYKLARRGKTVDREPKLVHVYEFRLLGFDPPRAAFLLRCTKGTYVRTICADIGEQLGCGAHLADLRRLRIGLFEVGDATPLDALLRMDRDALAPHILPLSRVTGAATAVLSPRANPP